MNLNVETWKDFLLSDYFEIVAGKYHYPNEYDIGETPYISASNENNGVAQKIDLVADFHGNCIVTGKVGCTAFYQPNDFCATSDVNVFYPKFKLNEKIGLFIVTVINFNENYKWGYGRQCRVGDSKEIIVKLPSTADNTPDWDFMEEYIKSLNHKPLSTANRGGYELHTLGVEKWKEFCLGELFSEMYKAEAHVKGEFECYDVLHNNTIRFISRTEMNNGCDCYVLNDKLTGIESGNAISIGDTTATCFYQAEDFVCGDHMVICRADWINKYTALFIISILMLDKQKYSYGRAFKMELISNTMLKLPATSEGTPDWRFMENYMKSLPYGDRI